MPMGRKALSTLLAALALSVVTAFTAFAASEFEGVWTVMGRKDQPFDITLSADGKASTDHPKKMSGTWTEEGGAAVIKWESGWTTKIMKEGDHFVKQTTTNDGKAGKTSDAKKKQ